MKTITTKLSLILALTLATSLGSAQAQTSLGNEGPQAQPIAPPPQVIASIFQGGGLIPPSPGPSSKQVEIYSNGQVQRTRFYFGGKQVTEPVAQLDSALINVLRNAAAKAKAGTLVDLTPNQPGCMDAPTTTYYAVNGGQKIVIGKDMECKRFSKSNATSDDQTIMEVLDAALGLANLIP